MSRGTENFVDQVRRVSRQEAQRAAPTVGKYLVVKLKPFTVEDLGSDSRLSVEDEDFEVSATIRADSKVGDTIVVITNARGEHVALGRTVPGGEADRGLTTEKKEREEAVNAEALARSVADSAEETARKSAVASEKSEREAAITAATAASRPTLILARVATTAALPTNTLTSNVLTASANAVLAAQDGITLAVGDRLLVWKETATSSLKHGVYEVTSLGSVSTKWTLKRIAVMDESAEVVPGMKVAVAQGTKYAGVTFTLLTTGTITLNTTALTFHYTTAPVAPAFLNSWVNYESTFRKVSYRKAPDGRVQLRGLVKNAGSVTLFTYSGIFTLPEGFRPLEGEIFTMVGSVGGAQAAQRVDVNEAGEVRYFALATGVPEYLPLTQIAFYAND